MTYLPKSRQSRLVVQQLANEVLIYDLQIDQAFCMNQTAALVYGLCDGTRSIAELRLELSRELQATVSGDLIRLALDGLKRSNLLEPAAEVEIGFNANRRQIIKKIGLASLVMLPIISAVVAPTAAMAASATGCVNPGGAPPGVHLGGAGGTGFCSTPNAANDTCTNIRGNLCCSGKAVSKGCFDSAPGPNFGTYSVDCNCA